MKRYVASIYLLMIFLMVTTACAPAMQTAAPSVADLTIRLLYPISTTEIQMGKSLKGIIQVSDNKGSVVRDAQVSLSLSDPNGRVITQTSAAFGDGEVYRTDSLPIPHKDQEGDWTITVNAKTGTHTGVLIQTFQVKNSLSETLLNRYGFWVDLPTLRGIVPTLVKERGDAQNGLVAMGGQIPAQHVFPENWLEVQWREGNFNLITEQDVSNFMMDTLGNPGVYPLRSLESIQRTTFKNWDAWLVKSRSQLSRYDEQWVIFYSPEVNKTYAIGTTVVLAPVGIDPHAALREGFEVHPEIQANGVAPKPLDQLLAPVKLVSPELGSHFVGTDQPIVLKWEPVRELAADEYYLVRIDYNYDEANLDVNYTTRETQFILPNSLYDIPNCGVFDWDITLMKKNGVRADGLPTGAPLTHRSLYWFILWSYPPGQEAPFNPLCPNEQY